MTEPAAHPHGHGRPLSDSEEACFAAVVADLSGDHPRVSRPRAVAPVQVRRGTARSGWPMWLASVLGVLLMVWGGVSDAGLPLLIGVLLAGTSRQWLRLPALADLWSRRG